MKWFKSEREKIQAIGKINYERGLARGKEEAGIPYPDAYQKRLEYWKGEFDRHNRVEYHFLCIWFKDSLFHLDFEDLDKLDEAYASLQDKVAQKESIFCYKDKTFVIDKITNFSKELHHPSPYTPAEIESWAKEKVEAEMGRWKVVLPEEGRVSFGNCFSGGYLSSVPFGRLNIHIDKGSIVKVD